MFTPKFSVEIKVSAKPSGMRWWNQASWVEDYDEPVSFGDFGDGCNREFADLRHSGWKGTRNMLALETRLVGNCVRRAKNAAEFEVLFHEAEDAFQDLFDVESERESDGFEMKNDLGVSAAVLALNAAGFPTFYSCNGHQTGYAYVCFFARQDALPFLKTAAESAGVGLINGNEGCLEIDSDVPDGLLRFATFLVEHRRKDA